MSKVRGIVHLEGPWAKNASRRIADNACRRVWTFNYMNATSSSVLVRPRPCMYVCVRANTCAFVHIRLRPCPYVCVRACTSASVPILWDLSERTRTHVNERTQAIGGRIYGREKNTRYAAGGREKNTRYAAG